MKPGFSVGASQNHQPHLSQIDANKSFHSKKSPAASNQSARWENAPSPQIPSVCFDLGNEWDDWGDFDDENLVHASETSSASCATNAGPQFQLSVSNSTSGRGRAVLLCVSSCGMTAFHSSSCNHLVCGYDFHMRPYVSGGGFANTAPGFLCQSHVTPCVTMARTPLG